MPRLRVRKLAQREINAAFAWYLRHSPGVAQSFLDAIDEAISVILEAPERQPVVRGRLRRILLRRFPYSVYYKVFSSVISVVGVIHGRRHPTKWLRRA